MEIKNIFIGKIKKYYYMYNKQNFIILFIPENIYSILESSIDFNSLQFDMDSVYDKLKGYDKMSQEYLMKFINEIKYNFFSEISQSANEKNLRSVDFMITNRCNLNCIHCSSRCKNNNVQMLSNKEIYRIIDKLAVLKLDRIVFTGGEPLLVDEIEKILAYARCKLEGTKIILSTNGTLIDKYVDCIVANIDVISISLDGYNDEITEQLRGRGVFKKVLDGIKLLQNKGFYNIKTSMVILNNNEKEMRKFIELNDKLKTDYIFRMLCNVGRAKDNKGYFREKNFSGYPVANFLLTSGINNKKYLNARACSAYEDKIYINHDGKIYPCPSLKMREFQVDNILDTNFTVDRLLIEMNNMKTKFLNLNAFFEDSKCEACSNKVFCWTCPADFIIAKQNDDINALCNIMKNKIEKLFI